MMQGQPYSPSSKVISDQATSASPSTAASDNKHADPRDLLEISHHSGRGRSWRPVLATGLLLFAAALAQAIVASGIRQKGIQINDSFFAESYYPTAGNPAIGFLALSVVACFVVLAVLDKKDCRGGWGKGVKLAATIYSSITLIAMAICSCGERAVHRELHRYEQCMDKISSENIERSECVCWNDQSDSVEVYIASDADISCDSLLDYVDDIFASYVLMLTILVLTAVGLWCRPYHSRPAILGVVLDSTPQPYVVTPTKSQQYGFSR